MADVDALFGKFADNFSAVDLSEFTEAATYNCGVVQRAAFYRLVDTVELTKHSQQHQTYPEQCGNKVKVAC